MKSIRGAITIKADSPDEVMHAANELYDGICNENSLDESEIVGLIISHTKDIRSLNSATALRMEGKCSTVPLFCVQEADIEGSMPLVIRMMAFVDRKGDVSHVYLGKTSKLRPDLAGKEPTDKH